MRAAELLARLRDAAVVLEVTAEGRLAYEALDRELTEDDLTLMRAHRDELVALLRAETAERARDAAVVDRARWRRGGFAAEVAAQGWTMPGPLGWCVACRQGTVWADALGRPRHPWCVARTRRPA